MNGVAVQVGVIFTLSLDNRPAYLDCVEFVETDPAVQDFLLAVRDVEEPCSPRFSKGMGVGQLAEPT